MVDILDATESKATLLRLVPWLWQCVSIPFRWMWHGGGDLLNLSKAVQICDVGVPRSPLDQPPMPRLEVTFRGFNGSMHPIRVRRVHGRIHGGMGQIGLFSGNIELASVFCPGQSHEADPMKMVVPPRAWFSLTVRQMINEREAELVLAASRNEGNRHISFGFTDLSVYIAVVSGAREHKLELPGGIQIDCKNHWRSGNLVQSWKL